MKTTTKLLPAEHDWLAAAPTRRVMAALLEAAPGGARFVGGCVRNALTGHKVDDIDIATVLEPEAAADALREADIAVHPTGIEHGTLTAVADHQPFEVTTLRRDVSTDGRRATVAFTTSWEEDSARRDFRLNAIYADADGTLFDPQGGVADALARRIVFIGRAEDRIAEDYLRILRFFRFFAFYGGTEPDAAGLAACAAMTDGIARLSAERIWKEMKKLLAAPDPRASIEAMASSGVLPAVLGGDGETGTLDRLIDLDPASDPLLRFAALIGGDASGYARRLKVSNAEKDRLKAALNPDLAEQVASHWQSRAGIERLVYRQGNDAVSDQIALMAARAVTPPDGWGGALAHARSFRAPVFPVTGADLLGAGMAHGPQVGETLKRLEEDWVASRFGLSKAELLARI
ncbi:CCA tRNA nucleotidyltransferase [Hyphobacterium marinum]